MLGHGRQTGDRRGGQTRLHAAARRDDKSRRGTAGPPTIPGGGPPGRIISPRGGGPTPGLITCAPGGGPVGPCGAMKGLPGGGRPPGCCGGGCRRWSSSRCCAGAGPDSAIDKTTGQIAPIARPDHRRRKSRAFPNRKDLPTLANRSSGRNPVALAFRSCAADISGREVGGGRATRQPGQVRKEAALTSAVRVARQPPTQRFAAPQLRGHFRGERSRTGRMHFEWHTGPRSREARAPLPGCAAILRALSL
jgi:hypothetical protein